MKIFLVGMPGSGKTTLGKNLASQLMMPFVDLDREVEHAEGKSIPDIFLERGESHFREVESRLLVQWAGSDKTFVMATGGGAPCYFQGIDVINKSGISIFLDVPVPALLARMKRRTNRPLLDANESEREQTLMRLLETRQSCYRKAQIVLQNPSLDRLMEAIHFRK